EGGSRERCGDAPDARQGPLRRHLRHQGRGRSRERAPARVTSQRGRGGRARCMTGRSAFLKAGHTPTLIAALLYFDVSFMAWVLLGPIAPFLRESFHLSATQQGLITAIPLLGGSLFLLL